MTTSISSGESNLHCSIGSFDAREEGVGKSNR